MSTLKNKISTLIANTRRQWLADIVYEYGVRGPKAWSLLGYGSKREFEKELRDSVQQQYNAQNKFS